MIMDEEVFAVLLALVIVASVFSIAMILRPKVVEPFMAIGLLNEKCKIGEYPKEAIVGSNITLCIFVSNYLGKPVMYEVIYRVGTNRTLPTNTTPSPEPEIAKWLGILDHEQNKTFLVKVPIMYPREGRVSRIALIFELWIYDVKNDKWVYTGRWVHLYLKPVEVMHAAS